MPTRALHPCRAPGCAELVQSGAFCTTHQPAVKREDDRATAHQRGYGIAWQKLRRAFLARHPLCVDPFKLHGTIAIVATDVDHIIPRANGGKDREDNLQSLCHSCHSRKTAVQTKFGGGGRIKSLAG